LGDEKLRDYERAIRLAHHACEVTKWELPDLRETLALTYVCRAVDLENQGQYGQAIQCYYSALEADSDHAMALFNLALLLAACPDEKLRRPQQAVQLAEQACHVAKKPGTKGWMILATAYAQAGQYRRAAMATEKALQLAEAAGDRPLTEALRRQLKLYENGGPNRPSAGKGP
jgi:tetratricopeptide (TPR) repeat protein